MLVRYNPLRMNLRRVPRLPALWEEDLFNDFWKGLNTLRTEEPKIKLKENKKNYLIRGEFPGYDKDEVKAEIVDGVLKLQAEHNDEKWDQDEDEGWRSIETRHGRFTRSIQLPEDVQLDQIKAEMKEGVLRITLPKTPQKEEPAKQIEIH